MTTEKKTELRKLQRINDNENMLVISDSPEIQEHAAEIIDFLKSKGIKEYANFSVHNRTDLRAAYKQIQDQRQVILNNMKLCNEQLGKEGWPQESKELDDFEKLYVQLTDKQQGILVKRDWQQKLKDSTKQLEFLEKQLNEIKIGAPEVMRNDK